MVTYLVCSYCELSRPVEHPLVPPGWVLFSENVREKVVYSVPEDPPHQQERILVASGITQPCEERGDCLFVVCLFVCLLVG